ncbi:MAG: heavy-metal-associated domain-containing protein [Bdellovibrionales bacterium]|nr:heavy-metal-associated domain-containing protein [Bdellovibrionales bacterium]
MATNKSVNFKVLGMHCGGCANKIKKSVETLNIEHSVDIHVDSGKVNIKFNSEQSSVANLRDSITTAGFQVESMELE